MATDTTVTSDKLTNVALSLLEKEENTSKRFFLWVHYLDPHADYLRHEGIDFGSKGRDLYDGEVAFTDRHIGRLIDAIEKAPWGKNTAIILTSDHGESFGENSYYAHGVWLWEALVRVPLVVHVPGATPRRVTERRSLVDLVPTVLDLMHVPTPRRVDSDRTSTDFVSGISLLADVYAKPGEALSKRDVLVDMPAGPYNIDARRALIHEDLKLIVTSESRFELYDLASDPGEDKNIATTSKGSLSTMKDRYAAMKAWLREIKVTGKPK